MLAKIDGELLKEDFLSNLRPEHPSIHEKDSLLKSLEDMSAEKVPEHISREYVITRNGSMNLNLRLQFFAIARFLNFKTKVN